MGRYIEVKTREKENELALFNKTEVKFKMVHSRSLDSKGET